MIIDSKSKLSIIFGFVHLRSPSELSVAIIRIRLGNVEHVQNFPTNWKIVYYMIEFATLIQSTVIVRLLSSGIVPHRIFSKMDRSWKNSNEATRWLNMICVQKRRLTITNEYSLAIFYAKGNQDKSLLHLKSDAYTNARLRDTITNYGFRIDTNACIFPDEKYGDCKLPNLSRTIFKSVLQYWSKGIKA
jgi:hypothetical protein